MQDLGCSIAEKIAMAWLPCSGVMHLLGRHAEHFVLRGQDLHIITYSMWVEVTHRNICGPTTSLFLHVGIVTFHNALLAGNAARIRLACCVCSMWYRCGNAKDGRANIKGTAGFEGLACTPTVLENFTLHRLLALATPRID